MGRHNGSSGVDGNHAAKSSDPSFTRWLPLSFSPSISSQPFRNEMFDLPKPWGNINCMYSPGIHVEYNPDDNGAGNWYNPPVPNFEPHPNQIALNTRGKGGKYTYVLIDANGDRIPLDENLQPNSPINSEFISTSSGTRLTHAGPPGHMRERGRYTYTFSTPPTLPAQPDPDNPPLYPPTPPTPAHLNSIADDLGNMQTLNWGTGVGTSSPFLTVTDLTSNRQLLFYRNGGYVTSVVAPIMFGTTPLITTGLTPDSNGHYTEVTVRDGGASGPVVRHDTFAYDQESQTTLWQGGIQTVNTYYDSPSQDIFDRPIRRLATTTVGQGNDAGTYTYSYGTITEGYGHYGVDSRTNTFTDALQNQWQTIYHYANPDNGGSDNGAISAIDTTGPTFTGASGPNKTRQSYVPDITKPEAAQFTNAFGMAWATEFNAQTGLPTKTQDPLTHLWHFYWGGADNTELQSVSDPTGLTWQFGYGAGGRMTSATDNAGIVRAQATYNTFGQLATATTPAGTSASGQNETSTYEYDATTGDLSKATGPTGSIWLAGEIGVSNSGYDALGDLLAYTLSPDTGDPATTANPLTTHIVYTAAQMPQQIVEPNGINHVTLLGPNSALIGFQTLDPNGTQLARINLQHDSRGRTTIASDLVGQLSSVTYDANSNVTSKIDGNGNAAGISYGPNNEPTGMYWPGGGGSSVLYDAAGRVRETTDERGIVRAYTYDAANRLLKVEIPGANGAANQDIVFTPDDAGRIVSVQDPTGQVTYTRDPITKRVTQVATQVGGFNYSIGYTYYADGNIHTYTSPAGTTTLTYDARGQVAQVVNSYGETTTWQRDAIGRTQQQRTLLASADITTTYAFGSTGQATDSSTAPLYLNQISQTINGVRLKGYQLTHSYLGQVTDREIRKKGTTNSAHYQYDNRGRLSDAYVEVGFAQSNYGATYNYDLSNNLYSDNGSGAGWTYNANNQVTSAPTAAPNNNFSGMPAVTGGQNLSYDPAGHLTHFNDWTLVWNDWGQLDHLTNDTTGQVVAYLYDPLGRRAAKLLDGAVAARYIYNNSALIAETDAAGAIVRSYTWGPSGLISDHDMATGGSRAYLYDETSHLRTLVNQNGGVVWQGTWTPWGEMLIGGLQDHYVAPLSGQSDLNHVPAPTALAWGGRWGGYTDSETGLVELGARFYAPSLARFISRDPSGYSAGPNLYAYCGDDPINFADADGYEEWWETVANAETGFADYLRPYTIDEAALSSTVFELGFNPGPQGPLGAVVSLIDSYGECGTQQGLADGGKNNAKALWLARARVAGETTAMAMVVAGPVTKAIGAESAEAVGAVEAAAEGPNCFPAGTPVQVAPQVAMASTVSTATERHGKRSKAAAVIAMARTKLIEQVRVGELLASRNDKTGKTEYKKVTRVSVRSSDHVIALGFADAKTGKVVEVVRATRQHPFYVDGKGWVPAGGLAVGNAIVTRAGPRLVVKSIQWERRAKGYTVYNFEVEGDHSYFVGKADGGLWVHNGPPYPLANTNTLQHEWAGHGSDFINKGNWNKAERELYKEALQDHMENALWKLKGTYRGTTPVVHYYDPSSRLWVAVNANDESQIVGAWKLTQQQEENLFREGSNIQ